MEHVGAKIRQLRDERGVKQKALARFADISTTMLYQIEHGERNPSLPTLERIAEALNVSPAEFFPPPEPAAIPKESAPQESGQPSISNLVMDAVRRTDEKDRQAIRRAHESGELQAAIPGPENAAIRHLAERDKGELIDGILELAESKREQEQEDARLREENARLREALEEVTQLREADR